MSKNDRKNRYLFPLTIVFIFIGTLVYGGEFLYVQSGKAKVFSDTSFDSKVIVELKRGDKVDVVGKEGNWYKVAIGGKKGFIAAFLLNSTPPLEKVRLTNHVVEKDFSDNPRSRASTQKTAVAGVRGLAQERRARLGKDEKVNYEALEKVESLNISEEELNLFVKEGR